MKFAKLLFSCACLLVFANVAAYPKEPQTYMSQMATMSAAKDAQQKSPPNEKIVKAENKKSSTSKRASRSNEIVIPSASKTASSDKDSDSEKNPSNENAPTNASNSASTNKAINASNSPNANNAINANNSANTKTSSSTNNSPNASNSPSANNAINASNPANKKTSSNANDAINANNPAIASNPASANALTNNDAINANALADTNASPNTNSYSEKNTASANNPPSTNKAINANNPANTKTSSNASNSENSIDPINASNSPNANALAEKNTSSAMSVTSSDNTTPNAASNETSVTADASKASVKIKPFVTFNYGATATWITRIKKQTGRSNFVFEDFLAGLYFTTELRNLVPFDIMLRVAAYYPLSYTFNKVPQTIAQALAFGFDGFLGANFKFSIFDRLYIDLSPGVHLLYQMSDRFNFIDLGIAAMLGLELPISRRWTILINGYASLDYGNLGTNMYMEPYDFVWQYQTSFGVRYSKRAQNPKPYINIKPRKK